MKSVQTHKSSVIGAIGSLIFLIASNSALALTTLHVSINSDNNPGGSNPSVTLINVSIDNSSAVGGNGGSYFALSATGNEGAGGVVADSVPKLEWKETMNKCRALFRAVQEAVGGL